MAPKHRADDAEERRRARSNRRRLLVLLGLLLVIASLVSLATDTVAWPFSALALPVGVVLLLLAARITLD